MLTCHQEAVFLAGGDFLPVTCHQEAVFLAGGVFGRGDLALFGAFLNEVPHKGRAVRD